MSLTNHDCFLIRALHCEGLSESEIAEKFEVHEVEVIQLLNPSEFHVTAKAFVRRERKGIMRISADRDCIEKPCSKCHEWYPLTLEFWHRQRANIDGDFAACRACELQRRNAYTRAQREAA
ncbi:hypothetical protein BZJ19_10170 [Salinivibrio proteolyticus]|uniref:hypothetical protein n=1 Tax=Salinivibrio proteolyticus TaxID=334715 RepID=UPI0009891F4B|nr:hypothetical protein [Salinivibrio proteolyticus]OOF25075.1 hypothetical protein BZJ19_10170 [Salinivibrio proteolyticus]